MRALKEGEIILSSQLTDEEKRTLVLIDHFTDEEKREIEEEFIKGDGPVYTLKETLAPDFRENLHKNRR